MFGDLNYDLFQHDNIMDNDLLDAVSDNSFYTLISKPTRITDTSTTGLDYVCANLYSDDIKTGVLLHSISDHLPVLNCNYTCYCRMMAVRTQCFVLTRYHYLNLRRW